MLIEQNNRSKFTLFELFMSRLSHVNAISKFPFLIHRSGQISKIHCHDHDFWELVYVQSGRGTGMNAGDKFEFHSKQLILTPPFLTHEFKSKNETSHEQFSLAIYPQYIAKGSIAQVQVNELLLRIQKSGNLMIDVPESDVWGVEQSLETISSEFLFQRADFESIISLEIARLLIYFNRILFDKQIPFPQLDKLPFVIHQAVKQIELKYFEICNIEQLLEKTNITINPKYFIKLFKKHIGFAPIQYLNRVRIEKSCSNLLHTNLPISNIALDSGFGDLRFFNRQFKRFVGITPREYRQAAKKNPKLPIPSNRFEFK